MSGRRAMRSLSGGIRSGPGILDSSMRIVLFEAELGAGEHGGDLGADRCGDGVRGLSFVKLARRSCRQALWRKWFNME